jgi:hypothetical protein
MGGDGWKGRAGKGNRRKRREWGGTGQTRRVGRDSSRKERAGGGGTGWKVARGERAEGIL